MKITKEETPSREVVLNIEMEGEDLEPYLVQAARRLGQRVSIPGFRQGKAPRALVENFLGREAIHEEAVDLLIAPTVEKALDQEGVEPFALPQVEVVSQEPVVLKALAPLKPEVELGDYKQIRVDSSEIEVTDQQVDEAIEGLRYDSSPWEPVEREARFGDLLTIDVDGWMDGQRITQDRSVNYVLRSDARLPLPGFAVHLEGLKGEEEKEFTLTVPEDYPDKSAVGKECRFKVKVLEVRAKQLPPLDDEFARSLGEDYESLEALREKVRQNLLEAAERGEEQRVQEEALSRLLEQAVVTHSPLLVEREVDRQLERREQALKQNRMDMDTYLSQVGKTGEEIREELREGVQRDLVRSLVLGHLAEDEKLEVSSEEVEEEIESISSRSKENAGPVRDIFSSSEGRRSVENMLLTRKVMARLREIATGALEEAAPDAPESQGDGEEKEPEAEGGKPDGEQA